MALIKLVVLLVVMEAVASMVLASPADFTIVNAIAAPPPPPFQVRCVYFGSQVFPWKTVERNHHVGHGFTPNIWGMSKYRCEFRWGERTQSFNVWYDKFFGAFWKKSPCRHCLWTVTEEGFFRENMGSGKREHMYTWK